MIGFIGASLQLHSQLHTFGDCLRLVSFPSYERPLFHGGWLVNFVTAFIVGSVATHCDGTEKYFPPFFFVISLGFWYQCALLLSPL
jgi:hypothetical protein